MEQSSYVMPVMWIGKEQNDTEKNISLKNRLGKMRKRSGICLMHFLSISHMKSSEEYCLRVFQLHVPRINEKELLKSRAQSFEQRSRATLLINKISATGSHKFNHPDKALILIK